MNLAEERKRLLERDAEWAAAAAEGRDLERILSFWTDDAVVVPPGMPAVKGMEALRRYVESSFRIPGFRITWTSDDVELSPDGLMAYMFSRNEVTVRDESGAPVTIAGRAVTVWRRGGVDDEWRCAVDIWNTEG